MGHNRQHEAKVSWALGLAQGGEGNGDPECEWRGENTRNKTNNNDGSILLRGSARDISALALTRRFRPGYEHAVSGVYCPSCMLTH